MAEALLRLTENTSLRGVQREDQEPVGTKRKQLDEMEFAEREIKLRSMRVDTVRNFSEVMSMLDEDWKQDSRLVQQTKDWCKNGLLTKQLLLTDGEPAPTLYIADVAHDLEIKLQPGDTAMIGKTLKKLYQDKHASEPLKQVQFVDGAERQVNVYSEADRDIMEEAIKEHFLQRTTRSQSSLGQPKERISTFFEPA